MPAHADCFQEFACAQRNAESGSENSFSEQLIPHGDRLRLLDPAVRGSGVTSFGSSNATKGCRYPHQRPRQLELVELRPLRRDDYETLYAVAADPLIWEQHPASNRHEKEVFRAFFREALSNGGSLVVIDVDTQAMIGSSRFHGYSEDRNEVEIGWTFLARRSWGGKYNREVKSLMLAHAFQFVRRVIFLIGPYNMRSQRAVEKIGAIRVGSRPDGSGVESYLYEISTKCR
jgi:RimJ/RimL family protein N-acetyltransferase